MWRVWNACWYVVAFRFSFCELEPGRATEGYDLQRYLLTLVGCVPTGMEALSIVALGFFENIPKPVFECFVESKVEWAKDVVEPEKRYEYVDEIEEYVGSVMAGEGYGA